ncbi:hypothetical protein EDD86DRAFT_212781 [Gorgonomyces haynaldii]|nr:hypothetical protein EDD86DRAFT_212781 [Gorgonomyces haynaldii]
MEARWHGSLWESRQIEWWSSHSWRRLSRFKLVLVVLHLSWIKLCLSCVELHLSWVKGRSESVESMWRFSEVVCLSHLLSELLWHLLSHCWSEIVWLSHCWSVAVWCSEWWSETIWLSHCWSVAVWCSEWWSETIWLSETAVWRSVVVGGTRSLTGIILTLRNHWRMMHLWIHWSHLLHGIEHGLIWPIIVPCLKSAQKPSLPAWMTWPASP